MSGYHTAKILARRVVSPTVVVLDLEVAKTLHFQPGQWLDFRVPPYEWVGGFSPASLPSELPKVRLAVKRSLHPPSQWVHSEESQQLGRPVQVQVGGNCVLDTARLETQPVVFCAGGIGISPLLSMYRQWTQLLQGKDSPQASFLYSVSTEEELVFGEELAQQAALANHRLIFTLTQQPSWSDALQTKLQDQGVDCRTGRHMKDFLLDADPTSAFYICGPPSMLDEGVDLLEKRGVDQRNLHYERWW
jgi:ferredoxin-NADP reductase